MIKIFFSTSIRSKLKKKKNQIFAVANFSCEILFVSRCKEYYIVEAKIGHVKLRRIRLKAVNTLGGGGRGEERREIGKNGVDEFPEKRKKT